MVLDDFSRLPEPLTVERESTPVDSNNPWTWQTPRKSTEMYNLVQGVEKYDGEHFNRSARRLLQKAARAIDCNTTVVANSAYKIDELQHQNEALRPDVRKQVKPNPNGVFRELPRSSRAGRRWIRPLKSGRLKLANQRET